MRIVGESTRVTRTSLALVRLRVVYVSAGILYILVRACVCKCGTDMGLLKVVTARKCTFSAPSERLPFELYHRCHIWR